MKHRATVLKSLIAPLATILLALALGVITGPLSAAVVLGLGLVAIALRNARGMAALLHWASGPLDASVPESGGAWGEAFANIHRRVRARTFIERELAGTIARFRRAAEAIPDGMVLLGSDDRIRWANQRAAAQLAISPTTDVGAPLVNLVREPAFVRYLAAGDFSSAIDIPSPREPGIRLSMLLIPFGVDERLLICRDVTLQEAVSRRHRDFIANVSHELKTPLTVIAGFVETMQDLELDERQRQRYLGLMQEQAKNMRRLVADLLTLSALESEEHASAESTFPVAPLLAELNVEARALSAGDHAIEMDIRDAANITGNREQLASAFANLVSNAVRYSPNGGRVRLAFRIDDDGSGVFSVTDSGIGIAPEHIPRITERFYRVDRSRSRATGGTGLGLAIVKHILLRHNAALEIESTVGEGSTFSARLPAMRVTRVAPALPTQEASRVASA